MRLIFFPLFLLVVFQCSSRGDELVPGVVTFDPPAFLYGGASRPPGDDSFARIHEIGQYHAGDNDLRTGQRLVIVNVREVGFSIDPDKVITYQKLDDSELRAWMQSMADSTHNATNITQVADAKVGGKAALMVSYQVAQPNWPKNPGALFPFEIYWERVQTNRVVEIKLIADTPEHLDTLRPCLEKFTIKRSD